MLLESAVNRLGNFFFRHVIVQQTCAYCARSCDGDGRTQRKPFVLRSNQREFPVENISETAERPPAQWYVIERFSRVIDPEPSRAHDDDIVYTGQPIYSYTERRLSPLPFSSSSSQDLDPFKPVATAPIHALSLFSVKRRHFLRFFFFYVFYHDSVPSLPRPVLWFF